MKHTVATLILASAVVAQDGLGALPDCARDCLAKFTTGSQIGDCARLDAKCICASDSFISGIACCLAEVCDADDQQAAVDYARTFCSTQGVTDLPQSVTCATAAGTSTSPTTAPTSGATTASSPSSTTTTTTSTTTPTSAVTPNAAAPAGLGSSNANLYGGLLAALAML
ncbi:putative extracellular membrane 8-cysteine CFEM [Rosellinia necatrix]|uniref:Putative extracellular membrane 8-cysteine CFEM n=1 Tax=Rosellinia necatrix TaxID=77044 RepID=A0A1W2TQ11_ROSNE|nr:putative extracellular membrane 8-cysteine CFEM [Rosellinia necatrix]